MFDAYTATPSLISLAHDFSAIDSIFGLWLDQQETKPWSEDAGFSSLQIIHLSSKNYFSVPASKQAASPRLNMGDLLSPVNRTVGVALRHCRICRPAGFTQQQLYKEVMFLSVTVLASTRLHLRIEA